MVEYYGSLIVSASKLGLYYSLIVFISSYMIELLINTLKNVNR